MTMETQVTVQSFLQEEVLDLVTDPVALDEWHAAVQELGLEGQMKIAEPQRSPIPYLHMTPAMVETFDTLCPREVELKKYDAAPIPSKALDLIKLALNEKHFKRIVIRYDDKSPDPVAIGEVGHHYIGWGEVPTGYKQYQHLSEEEVASFNTEHPKTSICFQVDHRYLIARWGAESKPLEELAAAAKVRYIREQSAVHNKAIKKAQQELVTLEEDATQKFGC